MADTQNPAKPSKMTLADWNTYMAKRALAYVMALPECPLCHGRDPRCRWNDAEHPPEREG